MSISAQTRGHGAAYTINLEKMVADRDATIAGMDDTAKQLRAQVAEWSQLAEDAVATAERLRVLHDKAEQRGNALAVTVAALRDAVTTDAESKEAFIERVRAILGADPDERVEALRKDAARYRWLRDTNHARLPLEDAEAGDIESILICDGDMSAVGAEPAELDAAVDAGIHGSAETKAAIAARMEAARTDSCAMLRDSARYRAMRREAMVRHTKQRGWYVSWHEPQALPTDSGVTFRDNVDAAVDRLVEFHRECDERDRKAQERQP